MFKSEFSVIFFTLIFLYSEQPEVTVSEQLTADNFLYGAAHTTLAMPHHVMILLRALCNKLCLFIT